MTAEVVHFLNDAIQADVFDEIIPSQILNLKAYKFCKMFTTENTHSFKSLISKIQFHSLMPNSSVV
jgi:hypothetical protein